MKRTWRLGRLATLIVRLLTRRTAADQSLRDLEPGAVCSMREDRTETREKERTP